MLAREGPTAPLPSSLWDRAAEARGPHHLGRYPCLLHDLQCRGDYVSSLTWKTTPVSRRRLGSLLPNSNSLSVVLLDLHGPNQPKGVVAELELGTHSVHTGCAGRAEQQLSAGAHPVLGSCDRDGRGLNPYQPTHCAGSRHTARTRQAISLLCAKSPTEHREGSS